MADWKKAFDVINNVLGIIATAASTPGINLIPYVSTVAAAASALQAGLSVGLKIEPYIEEIAKTFSGDLPTEAERAALDAKITELEAKIDAPIPPKEDGEDE